MFNYFLLFCVIAGAFLTLLSAFGAFVFMVIYLRDSESEYPPFALDNPEYLRNAITICGVLTIFFAFVVYNSFNYLVANAPHVFTEFGIWYAIGVVSSLWIDYMVKSELDLNDRLFIAVFVGFLGLVVTYFAVEIFFEKLSKKLKKK